jgi:predicted nucleic acid-binding protein
MLVAALAIWLACPLTADARAAPKRAPHFRALYANPYGHLEDGEFEWDSLPLAPIEPPAIPDLPLWDLQATLASLPQDDAGPPPEWVAWLRWTLARAQAQPATAHYTLVRALASDQLSAARLAWWRAIAPISVDTHDALFDAFDLATTPTTRLYLAAALALTHWELACPLPRAPDGACRAGQAIVLRDPIASESAQHWARIATKLRRKAKLAPTDIAAHALLAELELIGHDEDYERLLAARAPDDLSFLLEDWLGDSGDPELQRVWKRQFEQRERSMARLEAVFDSYERCRISQYELHRELVRVDARFATRVLLREATHLLAHADVYENIDTNSLDSRSLRRREAEAGTRSWACWTGPTVSDILRDVAQNMAQRCVALGTTLAGETGVVSACFALLEQLEHEPPLAELVPEPRSTTVMQRPTLVSPEFL